MATDAKLMLNTLWGEFGHPMNMTGTWQRRDTMRWQKTEAPHACRTVAVDTQERLDPRVKCSLWRWAITRTGVSASDASYLDVLDEHIVTYIIQLASWGVVQDRYAGHMFCSKKKRYVVCASLGSCINRGGCNP